MSSVYALRCFLIKSRLTTPHLPVDSTNEKSLLETFSAFSSPRMTLDTHFNMSFLSFIDSHSFKSTYADLIPFQIFESTSPEYSNSCSLSSWMQLIMFVDFSQRSSPWWSVSSNSLKDRAGSSSVAILHYKRGLNVSSGFITPRSLR